MHFFHMFCIFLIIFVSIASCFFFFLQVYGSLFFFFFFLCSLTIVSKRGRNLRIECHSLGGVIDLREELHVKGKNVFDVTNLGGELI